MEREKRTNLIINYLPQTLTDEEFNKMFGTIGPIKSSRIMKDMKQTGYSYGFGFVDYEKPEDAAKAILQMNNLQIQHKRMKVSYARPPGEDLKDTNLYIQGLPRDITMDQLEEMFSPFGTIVQKNILKDKVTGMQRGVGFVRYGKKSEADDAISEMNGKYVQSGTQPLVVKVAEEHGKMKAAYYAGWHAAQHPRGGRGAYRGLMRGGFPGRGAFNMQQGGGKMMGDRSGGNVGVVGVGGGQQRFNPMQGGAAGGYASGGYSGDYDEAAAYETGFSTESFSVDNRQGMGGTNYTSFSSGGNGKGYYYA